MAQVVETTIANNVTGMEEISKLINDVGVLQKEMKALQKTAANTTAPFNKAAKSVTQLTNDLGAQSKAFRQEKQGLQQVGMQINDFATSVSTGASITTAFNQQIGQLGYAMSMLQGKAGVVGRFLAGPWGAAITIAAMAIGQFFNSLSESEEQLEKTALASDKLGEAESILGGIFDLTTGKIKEQNPVLLANARAKIALAKIDAAREKAEGEADIRAIRRGRVQLTAGFGGGLSGLERVGDRTQDILDRFQRGVNTYSQALDQLQNRLESGGIEPDEFIRAVEAIDKVSMAGENLKTFEEAERAINGSADALAGFLKPAKDSANIIKRQQERLESLTEKLKDYILIHTAATDEIGKTQKKLDDFNDLVRELEGLPGGAAVVKELAEQIQAVRDSILNEGAESALEKFNAEIDKLMAKDLSPFEQSIKGLQDSLANPELGLKPEDTVRYYEAIQDSAASYFKNAIQGQQDLIDKAMGVDRSYEMQLQSLRDIITVTAAAGASTAELEQMLADFEANYAKIKIAERNAEIQKSYEAIGNAVANGFKGMITGAQSFGSAMKGIIQSVIDELFRLYVVQQIVGFVTGALGGIFGGGAAPAGGGGGGSGFGLPRGFASGGYPAPGKVALVGERGPELFVPTSSGKIIPNHQMGGGGGMVINVDARGSSDPEAVRQQVQQGILEAAPSIVAAAQNRTINTLRRPRLAGAL